MNINQIFEQYNSKYIELGGNIKQYGVISVKKASSSIFISMQNEQLLRLGRKGFMKLIDSNGNSCGYNGVKILDVINVINNIYIKYHNKELLLISKCGIKYKAIINVDVIENIININRYDNNKLKLSIIEFTSFIENNGNNYDYTNIDFNVTPPIRNEILEKNVVVYDDNTIKCDGKYAGFKLSEIPATYLISVIGIERGHRLYDQNLLDYINNNISNIKDRLLFERQFNIKKQQSIIYNEPKFKIRPSGKRVRLACPITNKYVYITEREAKDEIRRIAQSYGSKKKPHRCYECEHCNGWHLTSKLSSIELKFNNEIDDI